MLTGNDGKLYKSVPAVTGVYRWVRADAVKSKKQKKAQNQSRNLQLAKGDKKGSKGSKKSRKGSKKGSKNLVKVQRNQEKVVKNPAKAQRSQERLKERQ